MKEKTCSVCNRPHPTVIGCLSVTDAERKMEWMMGEKFRSDNAILTLDKRDCKEMLMDFAYQILARTR
jgi:hypothetical protein